MPFLPLIILLSIGLFLFIGESPKKEKEPEQELGEAIAKYLTKTKGNGSESKAS